MLTTPEGLVPVLENLTIALTPSSAITFGNCMTVATNFLSLTYWTPEQLTTRHGLALDNGQAPSYERPRPTDRSPGTGLWRDRPSPVVPKPHRDAAARGGSDRGWDSIGGAVGVLLVVLESGKSS